MRDKGGETAKPTGWVTVRLGCVVWADASTADSSRHSTARVRTNDLLVFMEPLRSADIAKKQVRGKQDRATDSRKKRVVEQLTSTGLNITPPDIGVKNTRTSSQRSLLGLCPLFPSADPHVQSCSFHLHR